jgi:outer membrane lipoprotein
MDMSKRTRQLTRGGRLWRYSLLAMAALWLSGCVTVPDELRGTTNTPQMDLTVVQMSPRLYRGQEARFGGRVVSVSNEAGRTRLEIACIPLDESAKPLIDQPSTGRIVAYINAFVDPVNLNDQLVTVVGPILGAQQGQIGNATYSFVTVQVNALKRWRVTQEVVMPPQPIGPWGYGGPYDPFWGRHWGPAWGGFPPAPARVENVVTE